MATTATPPTSHSGVLSRTPTSPVCWRCPPSTTLLTTLTVPVMYMHLSRTCLHQFHWISCLSHRSLTYIFTKKCYWKKYWTLKISYLYPLSTFLLFLKKNLLSLYSYEMTVSLSNNMYFKPFFFQYLIYMCKHSFYLLESFQIHC